MIRSYAESELLYSPVFQYDKQEVNYAERQKAAQNRL